MMVEEERKEKLKGRRMLALAKDKEEGIVIWPNPLI